MAWLSRLSRNLGLMVHNIKHPQADSQKTTVSHKVEEQILSPTTTLRRTTIEEIEIKPASDDQPASRNE